MGRGVDAERAGALWAWLCWAWLQCGRGNSQWAKLQCGLTIQKKYEDKNRWEMKYVMECVKWINVYLKKWNHSEGNGVRLGNLFFRQISSHRTADESEQRTKGRPGTRRLFRSPERNITVSTKSVGMEGTESKDAAMYEFYFFSDVFQKIHYFRLSYCRCPIIKISHT